MQPEGTAVVPLGHETCAGRGSAIHNILHRLAGEGMLDHIPRRGWRLRRFRQDDLQAFLDVREVLELKALELAGPKLDANELQRMLNANTLPRCSADPPRIDESLHDYLVKTAGNCTDPGSREAGHYALRVSRSLAITSVQYSKGRLVVTIRLVRF